MHYIHGDYTQQHQKAHVAAVHSDFDSVKQREILLLFLNKCKSTQVTPKYFVTFP